MAPISLESQHSYTVGWIAALTEERAAAVAMLQVPHAPPHNFVKAPNDQNAYRFGSIGGHNIVVTSLPAGMIGTVSAATTALPMLATFPNIRIGLMVGIGAGVPEAEPDMRLGDVAVSMPKDASGGVVQYDLGKAEEGGEFKRKGFLNAPPLALLNAIEALGSHHIMEGPRTEELVNDMLAKYPRMRKATGKTPAFEHPGMATDRLFDASCPHSGGSDCDACARVPGSVVKREARESTAPEIYYGIIASGNLVVKEARTRRKVASHAGTDAQSCICIEREAAGLMNSFPCLVIRGICDYADSHKNDAWHSYAAATAAAYARELLEAMDVTEVKQTPQAAERVKENLPKPPQGEPEKPRAPSGPRIECGRAEVVRQTDGSGTRIYFRNPFARPPVVSMTYRMDKSATFYNQRVYLLQDPPVKASTEDYFVAGCWSDDGGGPGTKFEFDWIAVEPAE